MIFFVLRYIAERQPSSFCLENVQGIVDSHPALVLMITDFLENIVDAQGHVKYKVYMKVLNAKASGVPQNRPRLFIVGIAVACVAPGAPEFRWPGDIPAPDIQKFLGHTLQSYPSVAQHVGPGRARIIAKAEKQARASGFDPQKDSIVVDHNSSKLNSMVGCSPCLTASRAKSGGHWMTWKRRTMRTDEIVKLMGVDPRRVAEWDRLLLASQLGQIAGNAIVVPVLERIVRRVMVQLGAMTMREVSDAEKPTR